MNRWIIIAVFFLSIHSSCQEKSLESRFSVEDIVMIKKDVISNNFIGNGVQWGGYDIVNSWLSGNSLSESDWDKLLTRIDYLSPKILRIIVTPSWSYDRGGVYDPNYRTQILFRILDYCQKRNIDVMYGEWGHRYNNNDVSQIDSSWINMSIQFLDYLLNVRGYTCIKHLNIVNEPNGDWSSTKGDYELWRDIQLAIIAEMKKYSITTVKLAAPDVAVWDGGYTPWLKRAVKDLGENMELFDIHTYPGQKIVHQNEFSELLRSYKKAIPDDSQIILGELGFKYTSKDPELLVDNQSAIDDDRYAGEDSNMKIYDSFYGIDMADAMIQAMRVGFSGVIVWNMDDAMYNYPTAPDNDWVTKKLKRWGFWNILGDEVFENALDEDIRPWFYPVSLLCRFFPKGADIYNVILPDKEGVRAIFVRKGNAVTIALVNSGTSVQYVVLQSEIDSFLTLDRYSYIALENKSFTGLVDSNGFAIPIEKNVTLDFTQGVELEMPIQSFIVYTNVKL